MKAIATIAFALSLLFGTAGPAAAAIHECAGKVHGIGVTADGAMSMRFANQNNHFFLCNTSSSAWGVAVDTCKAWMSQLLASWSMGRTVNLYFDTANAHNADMTGCDGANFDWGETRIPFVVITQPS